MIKRRTSTFVTLFTIAFGVAACSGGNGPDPGSATDPATTATATEQVASDLRSLLASEDRAESDRTRDAGRRPADVVEFLGIEKGMRENDNIPACGNYTEVLSL